MRIAVVLILALTSPIAGASIFSNIGGIVFDDSGERIYIATSGGLYTSRDGGATWNHPEDLADQRVNAVAIDPTREGRLYAGSWMGMWSSDDDGATWALQLEYPMLPVSAIIVGPDGSLYVSGAAGVHHSGDGGSTWKRLYGEEDEIAPLAALALDRSTGELWIGLPQGVPTPGLRWSDDQGATWNEATTTPVEQLVIDPRNGHHYVVTREGFEISRDSGRSRTPVELAEGTPLDLVLHSTKEGALFIGTHREDYGGTPAIWRSDDDGGSWRLIRRMSGLPALVTHHGDDLYVTFPSGILRISEDGKVSAFAVEIAVAQRREK